jgi:hypothetical protein
VTRKRRSATLLRIAPVANRLGKGLIGCMEDEFDFECKAGDPQPYVVIEFCTEERKALILCHQPNGNCAVPEEFATIMLGMELAEETANEDLPECGGSQDEVCDLITDCPDCEQAWKELIGCKEDESEFANLSAPSNANLMMLLECRLWIILSFFSLW